MMIDAELAVVTYLAETLTDPPAIRTEPQGDIPGIVITRIGGTARAFGTLDSPRMDVEVWGRTKEEAHDLMWDVRAALWDSPGYEYTQGEATARVTSIAEVMGPQYVPDAVIDGTPRYLFTVEWTVH